MCSVHMMYVLYCSCHYIEHHVNKVVGYVQTRVQTLPRAYIIRPVLPAGARTYAVGGTNSR